MLEFAAWRLVELVVTVAVAAILFALVLPANTAADAGILVERLGVTVPLIILAVLVAITVGLPTGYAAARVGSWLDVGLRALATLGSGLAPIWLAMLLVLLFSTTLRWLQPGGFVPWLQSPLGALVSLVLPALALGLPLGADLSLRMRDALRLAQADPAIRSAEVMGLTRTRAIHIHALRNALADLVARAAVPLSLLVPASLIVENVFYLPGLGRLIFTALEARDFATLQPGLTALVALIALCRFALRLLHAATDRRLARHA
jgi:peptide/nickel transport system permease protein